MVLYSYIFGVIVAYCSYFLYNKYNNIYTSVVVKPEKRYDYIVVGAGTAGCVLASRLSEDPSTKVLLIEAGNHMGYFTTIPLTTTAAQLGPNDWSFKTIPQKYSSFGLWDQLVYVFRAGEKVRGIGAVFHYSRPVRIGGLEIDELKDLESSQTESETMNANLTNNGPLTKRSGGVPKSQIIPRGKGLGGSGQINFMLHSFGLPEDYERWSRLGFKGWKMDDLKPYFVKAFGTVRSEFDSSHCTAHGYCPGNEVPMKLKMIDENDDLVATFRQASEEVKVDNVTFKKPTATVKDGVRHSTYEAYLKPALNRKNLHVLLKTQAISIRFEKNAAQSIYILQNNRELNNVFVNKEVVLSAGAIKTPQLLILSGIGPRDLIKRLRLNLVVENDRVGKNLHDHMNMPIYVSIKKPISVTLAKVFSASTVWNYYWNKRGLLAFPPVAGVEYHNGSALTLFSMGSASERLLRDLSNYKPQVFRNTYPYYNQSSMEGFMFLATCLQPRSRGSVTLKDPSVTVPPLVDPNYLYRYSDVTCLRKAIRRAESLMASNAFNSIGAKIHWPRTERCLTLWNYTREDQTGIQKKRRRKIKSPGSYQKVEQTQSTRSSKSLKTKSPPDEYLDCIIREVAVTGHHAGGTAAGGAVVDSDLRVKSVSGVRVVDASVFPAPLSLHPNSALVALAERAADIILDYTTPF